MAELTKIPELIRLPKYSRLGLKVTKCLNKQSTQLASSSASGTSEACKIDAVIMESEYDIFTNAPDRHDIIHRVYRAMFGKPFTADFLVLWAEKLKKQDRDVGAILLYVVASKMCEWDKYEPTENLMFIGRRIYDLCQCAEALVLKEPTVVSNYVINFMVDLLEMIKNLTGADQRRKASEEAAALGTMVFVCAITHKYKRGVGYGEAALGHLDRPQFSSQPPAWHQTLLYNLALCHHRIACDGRAENCLVRSLQLCKIIDFGGEELAIRAMKESESALKSVRAAAKKRDKRSAKFHAHFLGVAMTGALICISIMLIKSMVLLQDQIP